MQPDLPAQSSSPTAGFWNRLFNSPTQSFLLIAWIFGSITACLTAPFQAPDENLHFYRAYDVSEGHLGGTKIGTKVGGEMPRSLQQTVEDVNQDLPFHTERKQDPKAIFRLLHLPLRPEDRTFISYAAESWHSPLIYLPQALGMTSGRLLGLSPLALMYLGRLSNLLVWSLLIYACLKITPVFQWVFFLLALTPMSLFQASSLSADAATNGLSFLFVALILRLALSSEPSLRPKQLAALMLMGMALALAKTAYAPMILLFFVLPIRKLGSARRYMGMFILLGALSVATFVAWSLCTYGTGSYVDKGVSPHDQALNMLHHPLDAVLRNFWTLSIAFLCSIIGKLGWFDTRLSRLFIFAYFVGLMVVSMRSRLPGVSLSIRQKIVLGGTAFIVWIIVFTLIYLTFGQVGWRNIQGIQGRYLIPITPLLFLLLLDPAGKRREAPKIRGEIVTAGSVLSCLYMCWVLFQRYYLA